MTAKRKQRKAVTVKAWCVVDKRQLATGKPQFIAVLRTSALARGWRLHQSDEIVRRCRVIVE